MLIWEWFGAKLKLFHLRVYVVAIQSCLEFFYKSNINQNIFNAFLNNQALMEKE